MNAIYLYIFPDQLSSKIKYVLSEYIGLDKKQISEFKKFNSRWICNLKNFPGIFVSEHKLGIITIRRLTLILF
jgi:hypothetical protein